MEYVALVQEFMLRHSMLVIGNFFYAGSRFFIIYIVAAIVIALVVIYVRQPPEAGRSILKAARRVFSARVFFHPSALLDYRFISVNYFVKILIFSMSVWNALEITRWSLDALKFAFGEPGILGTPGPLAGLIFTLSLFVAGDGALFIGHWMHHKIPILWEFHKVHHSAEALTPLTVFRSHPVQIMVNSLVISVIYGTTNAIFLYLYVSPLAPVTVMGANALAFFVFIGGYHLRHSHIWVMYPKGIRNHISSPALHQIHHSNNPKHFNKNFARVFTFWDRLAGTLYIPEGKEEITFGIDEVDQQELRSVWQLYVTPFRKVSQRYLGRLDLGSSKMWGQG